MARKLKFKLLGPDPVNEGSIYKCKLCDEKMEESLLESHAVKHNRNSYQVDIDMKKDKTDGSSIFRSV